MKGYEVYVRQVDPKSYSRVLEDLKMKEIFNIIIDVKPERMVDLLNVVIKFSFHKCLKQYFCFIFFLFSNKFAQWKWLKLKFIKLSRLF